MTLGGFIFRFNDGLVVGCIPSGVTLVGDLDIGFAAVAAAAAAAAIAAFVLPFGLPRVGVGCVVGVLITCLVESVWMAKFVTDESV